MSAPVLNFLSTFDTPLLAVSTPFLMTKTHEIRLQRSTKQTLSSVYPVIFALNHCFARIGNQHLNKNSQCLSSSGPPWKVQREQLCFYADFYLGSIFIFIFHLGFVRRFTNIFNVVHFTRMLQIHRRYCFVEGDTQYEITNPFSRLDLCMRTQTG